MIDSVRNVLSCGAMMFLLSACNVGSDEGQQATVAASNQSVVTTPTQVQTAKPVVTSSINIATQSSKLDQPETYYLLLHGLNAVGKPVTNSYAFQKVISLQGDHSVQLIWFEPNRASDGSCLQELSGYALEYGQQPNNYNTRLTFDLASQDLACTTVGTTECGDVRECRYKLSL